MPKNKNASVRYDEIDRCLTNRLHKFPTLEYLAQKCSERVGLDIEEKTIEKDLFDMRHSAALAFYAPIAYNRQNRGYHYTEQGFSIRELPLSDEEWEALRYAANQLNQHKDIPIFANFKSAIERINTRFDIGLDISDTALGQFVQYETSIANVGYEWLADIYTSIKNVYSLKFEYENIYRKEIKNYSIIPYFLKEVKNRWYIVGWSDKKSQYLTFALDRIKALSVVAIKQKKRSDFNPQHFFKNSIGIMEGGDKPEIVKMTIKSPFSRLIKIEPLHHSQRILKESNNDIKIEIVVAINHELCYKLLSYGPNCIVEKPTTLVKELKRLLAETSKNYR